MVLKLLFVLEIFCVCSPVLQELLSLHELHIIKEYIHKLLNPDFTINFYIETVPYLKYSAKWSQQDMT